MADSKIESEIREGLCFSVKPEINGSLKSNQVISKKEIRHAREAWEKTFVLDTNVLLHNPEALFDFGDNEVVIPFTVLTEIDDQKKRQDEIGRNARRINNHLDGLREKGNLVEGVSVGKGIIRIELNNVHNGYLPKHLPSLNMNKPDNRILAVALGLKFAGKGKERHPRNVVLITKDINLRVRADVCGLMAEDYQKDKIDYSELYPGYSELDLGEEKKSELQRLKATSLPDGVKAYPNQFFLCLTDDEPIIACYKSGFLVSLEDLEEECWGIKPLNTGQRMAWELLTDDAIPVVTIVGNAGTGKTLLSLAVGMEMVVEKRCYDKLVVARPLVPMGNDIGYLPGDKDEKVDPWMQPIYDNLCYLMRSCKNPMEEITDLKKRDGLTIEVLTYIRGRSIPRQFIICDEAQNMTPLMIKTLITRVGEKTKIVFTGDPSQIDTPYLDASSNGLSYLVERLKGEEISGHVTLLKSERSEVAEICSRIL